MIKRLENNVWGISFGLFGSNVYLMKIKNKNILIDTSSYKNKEELISVLESLDMKPSDIDMIILTHNHWDHIQNMGLFINSNPLLQIYGSKKDFPENQYSEIKDIEELEKQFPELNIFKTPGHTPGSICIYLKQERILFSGDTLFYNGIGRTDFAESSPKEMENSLERLKEIPYKILCPGHNV